MKHLLLVRHGESNWNAEGRIQGQRCAGLSPSGHEQAEQMARALVRRHPAASLATSDLQRTVETAAPLAAALGVEAQVDPRLRERHFGAWEGRLRDDVRAEDADRWRRWRHGEDVIVEVGGEPAPVLVARVLEVFRALLDATADGGAAIAVTHGGTIWHGTHALLGLPVPSLGGVANASVAQLAVDGDGRWAVLDRWNEVGHLDVAVRPTGVQRRVSDAPPVAR